jgi:hypothetical protein
MTHLMKEGFLSLAILFLSQPAFGQWLGGYQKVSDESIHLVNDIARQIEADIHQANPSVNPSGNYTLMNEVRNAQSQVVAGYNYIFDADYLVVSNVEEKVKTSEILNP